MTLSEQPGVVLHAARGTALAAAWAYGRRMGGNTQRAHLDEDLVDHDELRDDPTMAVHEDKLASHLEGCVLRRPGRVLLRFPTASIRGAGYNRPELPGRSSRASASGTHRLSRLAINTSSIGGEAAVLQWCRSFSV
jgi:hypothetical protein